ncbi:tyrosine-type recombinase/integrase [Achromobacter mucicolens]|uniref:tyrosine-type recombinase/integrase n=1 Tax=Achromobacter mucicolens TaxID=1389922 RepID=UPI00289B2705|nr:tyrosine-type recombinase/integrase [Achromobacter mucicolens]
MRLGSYLSKVQEPGRFVPLPPARPFSWRLARAAQASGCGAHGSPTPAYWGHLRFHDLRHSAASQMINDKVDLYTVGAVLGHKSAASTKRYAHLATEAIKTAHSQIGKKTHTQKKTRAA